MTRFTCLVCARPLDVDDDSSEHLMPTSLGGALKEKGLLCKDCTSTFDHGVDTALERAFRSFNDMFDIRNARNGHIPDLVFEADGAKYRYDPGANHLTTAHPTRPIMTRHEDGTLRVSSTMPTGNPRLERQVRAGMEKAARKAHADGQAFTSEYQFTVRREPAPAVPIEVEVNFGDPLIIRAFTKIAFLTAARLLGATPRRGAVRAVLRGEEPGTITIFPGGAPEFGIPSHAVTLHRVGDGLGALVTLYGRVSVLVPLGPLPDLPYVLPGVVFDPIGHDVEFISSPDGTLADTDDTLARRSFEAIVRAGAWAATKRRVTEEALRASGLRDLKKGEQITRDHLDRFTLALMQGLMPHVSLAEE